MQCTFKAIAISDHIFIFYSLLQGQLINQLKDLLSQIGHRASNGCGAIPLSPASANEDQNGSVPALKEEPMETGEAALSNTLLSETRSNDEADRDAGASGTNSDEIMQTDDSDDKPMINPTTGASDGNSVESHNEDGAQTALLSTSKGGTYRVTNYSV